MPIVYENIEELSARTKLSPDWWINHCKRTDGNAPPYIKVDQDILFEPDLIDKWLKKHSRNLDTKQRIKNWMNNPDRER